MSNFVGPMQQVREIQEKPFYPSLLGLAHYDAVCFYMRKNINRKKLSSVFLAIPIFPPKTMAFRFRPR